LGSFAVEAAKPGTVLKLSDNLHNLLAAITLGLAALAALAALARKLPRAFRLPVLAVLVLGPWLIVLFPLRTRFFASLFTQGQVEGYYIAGLSLAAWLGVVLTAWRSARWEQ
jgi:hypothetical protein